MSASLAVMLTMGMLFPAMASGQRSMWVWGAPDDGVLEFSTANGVTDLYLHVPPGFSSDPNFATFLTDANALGLKVYAMAGDPSWAAQSAPWTAWVDEVVAHGGFDGLVFDVEPYLHPDWGTKKQARLIRSYLAGLDRAERASLDLPVMTAVPFWFDEISFKRGTVLERVLASTDGIIVMAYRDHADGVDGIIDLATTEAALASSMGRDFVIGVETGFVGLDKVSFAEEGQMAMEQELSLVEAEFTSTPGFGGVAIHHYGAYSSMAP